MRSVNTFLGFAIVVLFMTLNSCGKDGKNSDQCNVSNPTEDLDWLKKAIEEVKQDEYSYYAMATYEGATVFYYGNCNPVINYISIVKDCRGESLGYTNDLINDLSDITIIWIPKDSKCTFQEETQP